MRSSVAEGARDESDFLRHIIDPRSGGLTREYQRRVRRWVWKKRLREWRPRFRLHIRIVLFPKTQRRLEAAEKTIERQNWTIDSLRARIEKLEAEAGHE